METKKAGLLEMSVMFFPLFGFWLLLSPSINRESIAIGILLCCGILLYSRDILLRKEEMPLYSFKKIVILLTYIPVLLLEIAKSGMYVTKIVLNPALPIQPNFVNKNIKFKKNFSKVFFGNSVSLTPGTLTVDIAGDDFTIHVLTNDVTQGLEQSPMELYTKKMEE